ncbi:YqgE/AlgH family protein [uncultured Roseobacter sp.]|uniref:YqgE/AlgH family protein n=1 Tax=uncultured Roseobacter sp. TaxID=114847 RepID=UPI002610D6AD|nr:YqgE/AlgH family protein [uncultured Roseobacter sp.]
MARKTNSDDRLDLTGKLLVAMPGMGDARFEHAVVLLCAYSSKGAMGLILNKPSRDVRMSDVLDQLEIGPSARAAAMPVHFGGPVETGRGFVLHSDDYQSSLHTQKVPGGYGMTATLDILEDIARDAGPRQALMMLGYAGWGPGQLESEIARNGWLTADAAPALVFEADPARKWSKALGSLGIDPLGLSSVSGRA